jgi:hypothetical protein
VRGEPITSNLGIAIVTGRLVLLSAATPGRFRATTAVAGNDLDQVLGGRRIIAHWTYLAVVQGVLAGGRPKGVTEGIDFELLLPPGTRSPEGASAMPNAPEFVMPMMLPASAKRPWRGCVPARRAKPLNQPDAAQAQFWFPALKSLR